MTILKIHPTRINLIRTKKTLELAESGLDVLERKRDVLMRELRRFTYDAEKIREATHSALTRAFQSLMKANIMVGPETVERVAMTFSSKASFTLEHRSIMGVPVPIVNFQKEKDVKPDYGFAGTSVSLDKAFKAFYDVLGLLAQLAEAEGAVIRIANDIQKTQKRVNALKYVLIPMYRETVKHIELVLEEREREELVRMKMAKRIIVKGKYK